MIGDTQPPHLSNRVYKKCKLCGNLYPKHAINKHVQIVHLQEKWKCTICDKELRGQRKDVIRHMVKIHADWDRKLPTGEQLSLAEVTETIEKLKRSDEKRSLKKKRETRLTQLAREALHEEDEEKLRAVAHKVEPNGCETSKSIGGEAREKDQLLPTQTSLVDGSRPQNAPTGGDSHHAAQMLLAPNIRAPEISPLNGTQLDHEQIIDVQRLKRIAVRLLTASQIPVSKVRADCFYDLRSGTVSWAMLKEVMVQNPELDFRGTILLSGTNEPYLAIREQTGLEMAFEELIDNGVRDTELTVQSLVEVNEVKNEEEEAKPFMQMNGVKIEPYSGAYEQD